MERNRARRQAVRTFPLLTAVAAAACALAALTGCTASAQPTHTTAPASRMPATAQPTPAATARLIPGGTAEQNLPFFDQVNKQTVAANPNAVGSTFIDALAAAGFNKADMQVSADKTTVGLQPGSIQFSVKIGPSCLIGQYGSDIGGYHSMVAAPISTGKCLIGDTVPLS